MIEFGEFQLDTDKHVLRSGGVIVSLPLKAIELLCVLVENHGDVVTKEELMERVWADSFVEDSVLTQNIYLLRKTLETDGSKKLIINIPRRGYLFDADVRTVESNGSKALIERHVVEKISLGIEEETSEPTRISKPKGSRYFVKPGHYISGIALITVVAAGLFFYLRGDSSKTAALPFPPLRLKTVSGSSALKSLAVLPFTGEDEQFAAGFSRDLSVRLGSMNKFSVKQFALVREYAESGSEMKTDFVLDGEVRVKNSGFASTVRLIETSGRTEVWSEQFEYDNPVQLQDAIANKTAREILARLTPQELETISKRLPSNLAAYENFQTGYALWRRRSDGSAYLKRAIDLDQSYAPAYAILAGTMAMGGVKDSAPAKEAEELLQKAFALDENSADAYAVQGFIRMFHHRDWDGAEKSLKNALELDMNNINAHHWLGVLYSIHRRLDEAKAEMNIALELDPTNPTLLADIGQLHYFAGEKEIAIQFCKRALAVDAGHSFANSYLMLLATDANVRDDEGILDGLDSAADKYQFALPYINVDPQYDSLRDDKRFQEILRRMNL
ncbi:MAG: winged helix-turn-helix domain-containing tetratricopeptide repeat protein [Pyrinomonadaceae bacterium]